jgi:phage gp46-like protein
MAVDKSIVSVSECGGMADVEFSYADSLYNNIWLSIMTPRGARFNDKKFGSRMYLLKQKFKRNERALNFAKMYSEESLKWIIDIGRILSATVTPSYDAAVLNRINLNIDVIRSNLQPVTYTMWYDVV